MKETIFIEFDPITHNEDTYHWIYSLVENYSKEVKERKGQVRIVSELPDYQYIILEVKEESAYNKFLLSNTYSENRDKRGKYRLSRVPIFDSKELTKVTGYQALSLYINAYPEAPEIFPLNPKDIKVQYINTQAGRLQGVAHETFYAKLTHLPANIKVICGEERSKLANKEMAEKILKAKLVTKKIKESSNK